ncbi:hypothetical protein D3C76_640300 [compost metagenome]
MGRSHDTAAVDVEHAAASGTVTQDKVAIQVQSRAIAEVDGFPVGVTSGSVGGGVIEGQQITAVATVEERRLGQDGVIEIAQGCPVIAVFHQDRRADDPAAIPGQGVVAHAGTNLADDFASGHRDAVVAAADTDVAADPATGNDDGVGAKPGDQIAKNLPSRQIEQIVVELHVDPADAATGHPGGVTVLEGAGDRARAHLEKVTTVALGKRLDGPAAHHEGIDTIALVHSAGDLAGTDAERVGPVPLIDAPGDDAGVHAQGVVSGAERHIACDGASAIGGKGQGVVTRQVSQRSAVAAVTHEVVVAGGGRQGTGGVAGQ